MDKSALLTLIAIFSIPALIVTTLMVYFRDPKPTSSKAAAEWERAEREGGGS